MTALAAAAAVCAFAAASLAAAELLVARSGRPALRRVAAYGTRPQPAAEPSERRLPLVDPLARLALRLAPGRDRARTALQLHGAGLARLRPEHFLAGKTALALGGALAAGALGAAAGSPLGAAVAAATGAAIGFVLPDALLALRTRSRREAILSELPDALDLLAVVVEAGLGLDAALARYADTAGGPLADEIRLLVAELRVGGSRAEVLRRLADRVPSSETKSFVRSVIHADQLGSSLAGALRQQAAEARNRRHAVAEERANRAPVKMLFPTVFCIFPVLFAVVLGPVLLDLAQAL